jgi:hypothetical protein
MRDCSDSSALAVSVADIPFPLLLLLSLLEQVDV